MRTFLKILSFLGLTLTILPSILVFAGRMELQNQHHWTLAGTVLWFATAPFWLDGKKKLEN
ncbi:MAG: hypothetical protein FWJ85_06985 [Solitalea sp.]